MEEDFNNMENVDLDIEKKDDKLKSKIYKITIIIFISLIIIGIIGFICYLLIKKKDKDKKSEIEEENYSFKAIYETENYTENIELIYFKYKNRILKMNIDNEEKENISSNYTFKLPGEHIVYLLLNSTDLDDLEAMFYQNQNLKFL